MNAIVEGGFQSALLLVGTFSLVTGSLWIAGRLAPWFLQQAYAPPPVMSWFTDFEADLTVDRPRIVVGLIAFAITLFAMLSLALVVRLSGLSGSL